MTTVDLLIDLVLELVSGGAETDPEKRAAILDYGRKESEVLEALAAFGTSREVTLQILASLASKAVIEKVFVDRLQEEPRWKMLILPKVG